MEGESLFNDGMAVVAFGSLSALAYGVGGLTAQSGLLEFVQVVGIGIGIGSTIGFGISYITQRFDLPLVEQSLTLVSAYGVYLIAEDLGGSGVIAVVATGLILGNFGSRIGMSPRTRIIVTAFWEFLSFFVNSIVFLLIGDQIQFASLGRNISIIGITLIMMFITRAIGIYGLGWLNNLTTKTRIPVKDQTVLWWGGVRGSVSIALALSVSRSLGDRDTVIATVFGVVLFTLLVQGLTIQPLMTRLRMLGSQPLRQQYVEAIARHMALSRVLQHLNEVEARPNIEPEIYRNSEKAIRTELEQLQAEINRFEVENSAIRDWITEQLHNELIAIEADTYADLTRSGALSQELSSFLYSMFQDEKNSRD
jgi:CPA1 family monovalent cation:H+ antiporter